MDFTQLLLIIAIFLLIGIAGFLYLRLKSNSDSGSLQMLQNQIAQLTSQQGEKLDRTLKEVNDRLHEQGRNMNDQLHKSQLSMQQQFAISQRTLKDTTEQLTKLGETNKQVIGFAEQLQSLENILKNPKQRGVLGEYFLETVLQNVLPPDSFKMQYRFKDGEIVDAAIFTRDNLIPIDAKFSLENYNRLVTAETKEDRERIEKQFKEDIKNRINETAKYIRPEENTYDFAFMYVPADGLYFDLLVQKVGVIEATSIGIIEYAFQKRVIIVSPTTLFAYLQTVLQGLRALKIEESAKEIQTNVSKLQKHLSSYQEHFTRVGGHLQKAAGSYQTASDEFRKVDKDLLKITGAGMDQIAIPEKDEE